ncbi:DGQHR domain-containing protein [Rhizorhabdus dicambivorans]|uniref:DGQHR domain-containing protein n=1 Tax=Rhizorhabdus dicambivorans TaxID=1850238 RepID=A0A2A4FSW1_9SPHN|nr:DGQHR domain-containing protein [Rhizorhabdus dicambivorans]ATE66796.1 DGQHR domain-containing protein [Rhizorhabdus dicambivorans]PCE40786.1 DGQHR domain-containing protein [Rhizorhabdus dicambivorans]
MTFPLTVKALRVEQPLGVYFVAVIPARVLLQVAFSDALSATWSETEHTYKLDGTQRLRDPKRLKPVASYIDREDAAFPNSIILAANYRRDTGLLEEEGAPDDEHGGGDGANLWFITEQPDGCHELTIPSSAKLASVIDGQHRLFSFAEALSKRLDMDLICSVFLDLPKPYQAQLFATINSNQKPVDKSLTYEMFGYNIEEEDEKFWSPDKLAVYFTRRLAVDKDSPLNGRIHIAPVRGDDELDDQLRNEPWKVSTAVIVEAVMRLYTSNPKADTAALLKDRRKPRAEIAEMRADRSPLRAYYLAGKDAVIYTMVRNYLIACDQVFWSKATGNTFITKTVGVQALLDILRRLARPTIDSGDISVDHFTGQLEAAAMIDFTQDVFQNASGAGRSTIRRAIEDALGLPPIGRPRSA